MRKSSISLVLCLMAGLLSSGCASIFCGDHKTIKVASVPPKARFQIVDHKGDTVAEGVTPAKVRLKRGRGYFRPADYTATFTKDGYLPAETEVEYGLETGWYIAGNLFCPLGELGWFVIDPLTGAMWDIKDLDVRMERDPAQQPWKPAPKPPSPNVGKRIG